MQKKTKKILLGILFTIIIVVVLIIAFISPIAKYVIEKYSEQWTGRKIRVSWVYLNPFTGSVHLQGLKIYEYQSDSLFFTAQSVSANYAVLKTFSKTYEISSLTINKPNAIIIQDHDYLSFEDLIEKFTPKGPPDSTKAPTHFNLLDIAINDGVFRYVERSAKVDYYIKNVKIESAGLRWNTDTIGGKYYIENGPGTGNIQGNFGINLKSVDYKVSALIKNFDLQIIEQYLHDIANYGHFTAILDADIKATGNLSDSLNINTKGFLAVHDFHFGKVPGDDYLSFDRAAVSMTEVSPRDYKYIIDSAMVNHPYFKYELYDYLDNVQRMFGEKGSNYTAVKEDDTKFNLIIEIAKYMRVLAKNFLQSYYKVGKVAIYNGDIRFNDYSLREKFGIGADPLFFLADSIDKNNPWMTLSLKSGFKPYGNVGIVAKINPKKYSDFTINYNVQKVPLTAFNPYIVTYTSFPLKSGVMEANGKWFVKDSVIDSENHLLFIDPKRGARVRKKDTKWIPMPLILSILREPGSVMDYSIPIRGNLNHPKFILHDAIWDVIRNIFIKPPLTPYLVHVKDVEENVEKYQTLRWEMRQVKLRKRQDKYIKKIAAFLDKTPEASVSVYPLIYSEKEKENAMFFEAKKKYFLRDKHAAVLSEDDSMMLDKMSVKDSGFITYLNHIIKDSMVFTLQEKCRRFVGAAAINKSYEQLNKAREKVFLSYFSDNSRNRVKIFAPEIGVPFNGFSYYKIEYNGELPAALVKAYDQMNNLDSEDPRDKYGMERRKNRDVLKKDM